MKERFCFVTEKINKCNDMMAILLLCLLPTIIGQIEYYLLSTIDKNGVLLSSQYEGMNIETAFIAVIIGPILESVLIIMYSKIYHRDYSLNVL